jgi:hypothetical protein
MLKRLYQRECGHVRIAEIADVIASQQTRPLQVLGLDRITPYSGHCPRDVMSWSGWRQTVGFQGAPTIDGCRADAKCQERP